MFVFPLSDFKMFNGVPHINRKDKTAEIYLKQHEMVCEFSEKAQMNQFVDHLNKLLTGETGFERGVKKTKEAIVSTVGEDTIDEAGKIIKEGVLNKIADFFGVKAKKE